MTTLYNLYKLITNCFFAATLGYILYGITSKQFNIIFLGILALIGIKIIKSFFDFHYERHLSVLYTFIVFNIISFQYPLVEKLIDAASDIMKYLTINEENHKYLYPSDDRYLSFAISISKMRKLRANKPMYDIRLIMYHDDSKYPPYHISIIDNYHWEKPEEVLFHNSFDYDDKFVKFFNSKDPNKDITNLFMDDIMTDYSKFIVEKKNKDLYVESLNKLNKILRNYVPREGLYSKKYLMEVSKLKENF